MHPAFRVGSESAVRAVQECAPFNFLPVAKYELWQDITSTSIRQKCSAAEGEGRD